MPRKRLHDPYHGKTRNECLQSHRRLVGATVWLHEVQRLLHRIDLPGCDDIRRFQMGNEVNVRAAILVNLAYGSGFVAWA